MQWIKVKSYFSSNNDFIFTAASVPKSGVCNVRANPDVDKRVNSKFHGKWINSANIGKIQDQIIALWNEAHPDDLDENLANCMPVASPCLLPDQP